MQNYNEILEKLKDILSLELKNKKVFDKDIALVLKIDYDNFRKQKARGTIPYYEIMSFLAKRNISINWFFFNQLPESLIENTSNYILIRYQKNVIASAGGGAINYEINTEPLIIDKQLLDHINSSYKYTEIIKVFGESMEPDIKDGSLVFVDKSKKEIDNKSIYLVNTKDGVFIKRLILKDNEYYMQSINAIYNNMKIEEFDIIGRIKGILIRM